MGPSRTRAIANDLMRRMRSDERGVVAIEFAHVFGPFLMLLFGVIAVSLFFFTETVLEQALANSVRQVRTGQSRTLPGGELKVGALRQAICNAASGMLDCSKLNLHIQSAKDWSSLKPRVNCIANKKLAASSFSAGDTVGLLADADLVSKGAGGRTSAVVITACYSWGLWVTIPYVDVGNIDDGKAIVIQSVRAFESEPY